MYYVRHVKSQEQLLKTDVIGFFVYYLVQLRDLKDQNLLIYSSYTCPFSGISTA